MAFTWAGSLVGGGPIVRELDISETLYVGQLLQGGNKAGTGGHVQILDAATEALENELLPIGICTGVVDGSRTFDSTYKGDKSTYTTTQATVAAYGPARVQVTLIRPWIDLIKGPICYTAYGTAPTVLTESSGSSGGTVATHAAAAVTDTADDLCTLYCRSGANRGLYRVITTGATGSQTVTVPFPNAIAIGDTFVKVACVLGVGGLQIIGTADCIDGDNALSSYYGVYYHEINCEKAGEEYAIFSFLPVSIDGVAGT